MGESRTRRSGGCVDPLGVAKDGAECEGDAPTGVDVGAAGPATNGVHALMAAGGNLAMVQLQSAGKDARRPGKEERMWSEVVGHPAAGGRQRLASIYFSDANAALASPDLGVLFEVATTSLESEVQEIEVRGYSSVDGDAGANMRLSLSRCHAVTEALSAALIERAEGEVPKVTYQALGEAGGDSARLAHRRVDVFSVRMVARRPADAEQRSERRAPTTPTEVAKKRALKKRLAEVEEELEVLRDQLYTYQKMAASYGSTRWEADPQTPAEVVAEMAETLTTDAQDRKLDIKHRHRHRREFEALADDADRRIQEFEQQADALRAELITMGERID